MTIKIDKVLIVDDDVHALKYLQKVLAKSCYKVSAARSGREALSLVREQPPDLLVIDMVLSDQYGMDVIVAMKRICPELKIIAISGGGGYEAGVYLEVAIELGADRVIQKPFPPERLIGTILELT